VEKIYYEVIMKKVIMKNVGHKAVLVSIDFDCTKYNTWKSYCSRKTWMCI